MIFPYGLRGGTHWCAFVSRGFATIVGTITDQLSLQHAPNHRYVSDFV
jgi:hypothetical protein